MEIRRLGRVDYEPTWHAMREFTAARTPESPDELWVVEHPPVFTLGQAGKREHILSDVGIPVVKIDRGGQVTYHGPGQVVIYLLLDLQRLKIKVRELVTDNYATHKHPTVQAWLAKHPRFNMHFTPTSASWLNMVERFFRDITVNRLRRGVFTSVPELVAAIDEYVAHHNTDPKPFIWTKSADDILQKVIRANSRLSSKQNATLH